MRHYRVNKLAKPDGVVVKQKDLLAADAKEALDRARTDPDCPVCEVWQAGRKVGEI